MIVLSVSCLIHGHSGHEFVPALPDLHAYVLAMPLYLLSLHMLGQNVCNVRVSLYLDYFYFTIAYFVLQPELVDFNVPYFA